MSLEKPATIRCIVIAGDSKANDLLRIVSGDNFKAFAEVFEVILTMNANGGRKECLEALKKIFEGAGMLVVAVFIPNSPVGAWMDKGITRISDGVKWYKFEDVLKEYQFLEASSICCPKCLKTKHIVRGADYDKPAGSALVYRCNDCGIAVMNVLL
jgi:hypothetical protein